MRNIVIIMVRNGNRLSGETMGKFERLKPTQFCGAGVEGWKGNECNDVLIIEKVKALPRWVSLHNYI
jgi:hypothetical protein